MNYLDSNFNQIYTSQSSFVATYVSLVSFSDYTVTTNSDTMVNLVKGNQT